MTLLQRLSDVINDLVQPRRVVHVAPPPPVELADVARSAIWRVVIAEVISGSDSTIADKATFVVAPLLIDAVALWGAEAGARDRAAEGPVRRGSIDVDGERI